MPHWIKDPEATLEWQFDWKAKTHGTGKSDWLESDETITAHTVIAKGVTVVSSSEADGAVTVWLSGGKDGRPAEVTCEITTSKGRTDQRSLPITIMDR